MRGRPSICRLLGRGARQPDSRSVCLVLWLSRGAPCPAPLHREAMGFMHFSAWTGDGACPRGSLILSPAARTSCLPKGLRCTRSSRQRCSCASGQRICQGPSSPSCSPGWAHPWGRVLSSCRRSRQRYQTALSDSPGGVLALQPLKQSTWDHGGHACLQCLMHKAVS